MECNKSVEIRVHETLSSEYVTCEFDTTKPKENEKNICNKTCRVCLLDSGDIPIFGNGISPDISADVTEFGGIEININDIFPKYICDSCSKLLEAAVMFRKTAKQSDESLRGRDICYENADNAYEPLECLKIETNIDSDYEDNGIFETESTVNIKDEFTAESSVVNYHVNENDNEDTLLKETINISADDITAQHLQNVDENSDIIFRTPNKYDCKTCDLNFPSSKQYSNHKKSTQHKKATFSDKVECKVCSKEISSAYYNRHLEMHSSECKDDKLQCPICNKSYSKTYFNYHITHTHNKEHKKTQADRIECSICNKSYEKQYYKFHLAIHDNTSSKYVCDTCGKSFIQQSAFKRHRLVHSTELAYKCSLCPYRGRHPGLVKTHMQTHTRDYQHRCMECPARFLTKSNLNKHLQRHKGPVDFKCETCKRGFYSKLELDRHFEADHLGVKNHVCNVCGKAFGYRNAMMSHQLKVHKREKLTNGKGRLPLYLEAERKNEN
ncbi:hypothetical protein MSG28_014147 [Choristoneura fumiferana]|uniref:Uncharacterized protein n=1 Tax=Choristoneura fumiferana TaxID=7141 RepID=A0ACC0JG96_CHOFU|nr:hypothetical protein MSG28_014147 [Choristoneura fumiferana]